MTDVTQILNRMDDGDASAAEELLPLVYDELRQLAAQRLANEKAGQTLQATALVHEAYIRLVDAEKPQEWEGRGHFFSAAAEAMRRIMVDNARKKKSVKRGGDIGRVVLDEDKVADSAETVELLELHELLDKLSEADPVSAELVKLRYFAGLTVDQAAAALGVSPRTARYMWTYARAWLRREMRDS